MQLLYQIISATFCTLVVVSSIMSAKMTTIPLFDLQIPAGLITYPLTFFLSDLITEFFGAKLAKRTVYIAFGMSLLSLAMIQLALWLPSETENPAFQAVLGLSGLRTFSSLTAYAIAQMADIYLYALIRKWTGPKWLWLRNNGATCLSQLIDTVAVDIIFLYWGLGMSMQQVLPIMVFSYLYKACFSVTSTPLFYLFVLWIRKKWPQVHHEQPI
jgi:queuosine precursor transporter